MVPLAATRGGVGAEAARHPAQGYTDIALGAMTATATFLLGKIVVESILESRRERFSAKGQPAAAIKARETTLDGIIKLAGMTFSIWQISQQFPEVLAATKKLLP